MEDIRFCAFCKTRAELVCHRCRDPYCSKKCQQIDWPQHKFMCFPMPLLVKPLGISCAKQEPEIKSDLSIGSPSPTKSLRNLKLSTECALGTEQKQKNPIVDSTIRTNNFFSGNIPSGVKSETIDKPDAKNAFKSYYKSDNIDVASLRKPGTFSQVMPKQMTIQPTKHVMVEPPQKVMVEPPKQVSVDPPKQVRVEPPKQANVEPPQKVMAKPPQKVLAEPSTQVSVDPPKQVRVEPPKQVSVEPPQKVIVEPAMQVTIAQPKEGTIDVIPSVNEMSSTSTVTVPSPKGLSAQPEKIETRPWMQPFPIEDSIFVDVIIQYVAPDNMTWVSMAKHEDENNFLLRDINNDISQTSTPSPIEIKVNALFFVPFEDIYYRGIVLQPVTPEGTVLVRLVDYGNEISLSIGELKTPLPAVAEKNAFAFPIKFRTPRDVEVGNCIKIRKESVDNGVMTVIVEGETAGFTMKDIDAIPIPVGAKKDLLCVDYSNVGTGYISVCIPDKKAIQFIDAMGSKMTDYCKRSKDGAYSPHVNELCLAEFEDGQWYRAVALEVIDGNKFEIMFVDYGNIMTVNSSSIRKMIDDFLHPCLTNMCFIKSFPKTPSKSDIQKMQLYFAEHTTFQAETVEKSKDGYVIHVNF